MGPPAKWLSGCKASTAGSNPALPATAQEPESIRVLLINNINQVNSDKIQAQVKKE